jgi:hypothetical protein
MNYLQFILLLELFVLLLMIITRSMQFRDKIVGPNPGSQTPLREIDPPCFTPRTLT